VPSLLLFIALAYLWIELSYGTPASAGVSVGNDWFGGLLSAAIRGIAGALDLVNSVSRWIAGVLSSAFLAATVLGAGLFLTGRGLLRRAMWARIAGALFTLVALYICVDLMFVLSLKPAGGVAALAGGCIYAAWVLGFRFSKVG
jgi:hypothetical protein